MMRRLSVGFTLVELLVTLVVVGILAALAAPAFDGVFERARADTDTGDLVRALNLARLEAVNRGVNVSVQPDGDDAGWDGPLLVQVSGVGGADIRSIPGMASGAVVDTGGDTVDAVEFNNHGALQSPASGVTFSYSRGDYSKTVSVCATGRVHTGGACQ